MLIMKISVKLAGICTMHWFYLTLGQIAKGTSRCSAPPAELTKEATVTCIFPVDVRISKTDFDVYHENEQVADCMSVYGRPECALKPGYEQDDQLVEKRFTLRISHFLQNHTGRNWCALGGYETEKCSLFKRAVPATSQEPAWQPTVTHAPLINLEDGTSDDDKATSTVLIIVVPTVVACIAVALAAVVGYFVYKCFRIKNNTRKPDNVPTIETGGQDSMESCATQLIERKPPPESTAASISLLSQPGDRTEFCERYNSSNLQQEKTEMCENSH